MHQNNRIALPSLDVGELRTVDAYLFDVGSDSWCQMQGRENEFRLSETLVPSRMESPRILKQTRISWRYKHRNAALVSPLDQPQV